MKKLLSLALILCLLLAALPSAAMAYATVLSPQNLTVDGQSITCEKYNIDGSNYFKLRDIAYLLNGTAYSFAVSWDAAANAVVIAPGFPYEPVGGELAVGADKSATAVPSAQTVWFLDAPADDLSVYNIGGNNFFKLRDLGTLLGFTVDFDSATNTAQVFTGAPVRTAPAAELNAEQIFARCAPAVVFVTVYDANRRAFATGSGFFIEQSGVMVTNYHVISGASYATVQTSDTGAVYDVLGVYAWDAEEDWAVVQVDGSGFATLPVDASGTVAGGAKTFAIGSPLGLQNTISEGIVSNPARVLDGISYIQTDSAISHGSSGGALINKYGQAIGITCGGFDEGQNLNLAVPMRYVQYSTAGGYTALAQATARRSGAVTGAPTSVTGTEDALAVLRAYLEQLGSVSKFFADDGTPVSYYSLDYMDEDTGTVFSLLYEDYWGGTCLEMWMPLDEGEVDAYLFLSGMDEAGDMADTSIYLADYEAEAEDFGEAWIGRKTIMDQSTVSFYNFDSQTGLPRSDCEEICCMSMQLIVELSDDLFSYFGIPLTIADFGFAGGSAAPTPPAPSGGGQAAAYDAMKQWIGANYNDTIGDDRDKGYFYSEDFDDGSSQLLAAIYAPGSEAIILLCEYDFADGDTDFSMLFLTREGQNYSFYYDYTLSGESDPYYEGETEIAAAGFIGYSPINLTQTGGETCTADELAVVAEYASGSVSDSLWLGEYIFGELMSPAGTYSMADFGFDTDMM